LFRNESDANSGDPWKPNGLVAMICYHKSLARSTGLEPVMGNVEGGEESVKIANADLNGKTWTCYQLPRALVTSRAKY
jgi:rhamnose utilization protein RhaD (predicted bifunctional aldolase and dehydrogenase)